MTSILHLPQPLSLPTIHAHWTVALSLPPTAQLSNLRRLVRALTQHHHPALRPLSLAALCQLYLDLALAYAFLGEYYLASKVFKEAVLNDATCAVGWFGLGLAQAELTDWRDARRSWKECLRCFGPIGGQSESISYPLFHGHDGQMLRLGLDSGEWTLERTRVEFNFRVALREKGSKKLGVAPRAAGQKRPGLNGIPAGLRFGPGWDASLQSLDSPLLAQYTSYRLEEPEEEAGFTSDPQPAVRTPPSSSTSPPTTLPPRISSHKPLPELPRSPPTSIPSLADEGSFNDHRPSLDEDPFTSSPGKAILHTFATSSQTLTAPPYDEHYERFSRQPTLFIPEDQYFYDRPDEDDDHDSFTAIDDTIVTWSGLSQNQQEHTQQDTTHELEEAETGTYEKTSQIDSDVDDDGDGEILQPRVFEGFGPSSQER